MNTGPHTPQVKWVFCTPKQQNRMKTLLCPVISIAEV
jgi:hypothetical protein